MASVRERFALIDEDMSGTDKRIPMCLCIDRSASMLLNGAMARVNAGIVNFLQNIEKDSISRGAARICIVSFSKDAQVVCDFGKLDRTLEHVRKNPIVAMGTETCLAAGVKLTLNCLDEYMELIDKTNNNKYTPWLIIISDGDSTEPEKLVNEVSDDVRRRLKEGKLKTMCLNIGAGSATLPKFTQDGKVGRLDTLQSVDDFFSLLSRSISVVSRSAIEKGDFELTDEWK